MDIPHLFIQSSVDGHFSCLQLLAIINNVYMKNSQNKIQTSYPGLHGPIPVTA